MNELLLQGLSELGLDVSRAETLEPSLPCCWKRIR